MLPKVIWDHNRYLYIYIHGTTIYFTYILHLSYKGELKSICQEYYRRICDVENSKYDLEKEVEFKDYQVPLLFVKLQKY